MSEIKKIISIMIENRSFLRQFLLPEHNNYLIESFPILISYTIKEDIGNKIYK